MHTFNARQTTIFHDNDIRSGGRIHIQNDGTGAGFSCPQQAIVEFVAHLIAQEKISELEQLKAAVFAAANAMAEASDLLMTLPGGHQAVTDVLDSARTNLRQALRAARL